MPPDPTRTDRARTAGRSGRRHLGTRCPMSARLTALDTSFLELEGGGAHMHIGAAMVFAGRAPTHAELADAIAANLHLIPAYRQRLAYVPYGQGRPVLVDDPGFDIRDHIRDVALRRPGTDVEL